MLIRFSHVDDFLEELKLEGAGVERRIVRVTIINKMMKAMPLREVTVVGTAVAGGHILRVDHFIGEQMMGIPGDKVPQATDRLVAELTEKLRALDLRGPDGVFTESGLLP